MFKVIITFIIGFLLGEATGFFRKLYAAYKLMSTGKEEKVQLGYLR